MKAEYKRDLQNNYMILELPETTETDGYLLRMAEQNEIEGLLPFHCSRLDGKCCLNYEITSKQPLNVLYERRLLGSQDLLFLLSGIRQILENLQKYLLDPAWLIFDPAYIYVGAGSRQLYLCYCPGLPDHIPITVLAEFILKRLDHEDRQAVVLGYSFYQRASEENFSLQKTLRELLDALKEKDDAPMEEEAVFGNTGERRSVPEMENRQSDRMQGTNETSEWDDSAYEVMHKMRKSRSGKEEVIREEERNAERNTERNTERTKKKAKHEGQREGQIKYLPAILSVLFFFAVIEICFYFGLLRLQEAGGLFFLVTAVEVLIIKYRKKKKEKRRKDEESWDDEDEVYRMLQEEMYELQDKPQDEAEEIQETRCLIPSGQDDGVLLVCRTQTGTEHFPDIHLGTEPLYIGKKKGESDVLLDSPTVSRLHARLELQQGRCLVRDLNSKNGTFVNGDRLRPQEQRELVPGDRIAFAEVEYYFTRNQ